MGWYEVYRWDAIDAEDRECQCDHQAGRQQQVITPKPVSLD